LLARALSPVEARPQVVAGIEAVQHQTRAGRPYVLIHNPAAHTYLRLDPREFDLLSEMDGTRTVKALVIAYYRRHGILDFPRIADLVDLLRRHHFLTESPPDAYAALASHLRPGGAGALLSRLARGALQ